MRDNIVLLLIQLRIFDKDQTLSLTSILLMVAIVRLAFFAADFYTIGILTLALANYNGKKFANHKSKAQDIAVTEKQVADQQGLAKVIEDIKTLNANFSLKNLIR